MVMATATPKIPDANREHEGLSEIEDVPRRPTGFNVHYNGAAVQDCLQLQR